MARTGKNTQAGHRGPSPPDGGDGLDGLLSPAALCLGGGPWARLAELSPPVARTRLRVVLPMALVAPVMMLFAVQHHPEAYGLADYAANWEWIAIAVLVAELASVRLMAAALRGGTPAGRPVPTPEQAYLLAGLSAIPLWASAMVLAVPNLAVVVAAHLLGHFFCLRVLCRGTRALLPGSSDVEVVYVAHVTHVAAAVIWVLLFGFFLLSLHGA